jgi:hypothetical protein
LTSSHTDDTPTPYFHKNNDYLFIFSPPPTQTADAPGAAAAGLEPLAAGEISDAVAAPAHAGARDGARWRAPAHADDAHAPDEGARALLAPRMSQSGHSIITLCKIENPTALKNVFFFFFFFFFFFCCCEFCD